MFHSRNGHPEARDVAAVKWNASEMNRTLIFLNDSFADPQTQSRSLGCFGAKEWLEYAFGMFRADAETGIAN